MSELQMGAVESRFADIIWQNEPIATGELAKRSEELLSWKKTTSYTVLKRLCDKLLYMQQLVCQANASLVVLPLRALKATL